MAGADGKGTRRRAGNRARVEFALTRPVAASGVVARLVAGRVNSNPRNRRRASRSARGSKKLFSSSFVSWASSARHVLGRIKFLAMKGNARAKKCLFPELKHNWMHLDECNRRALQVGKFIPFSTL